MRRRPRSNDFDAGRDLNDAAFSGGVFDVCQQALFKAGAIDKNKVSFGNGGQVSGAGLETVRVGADWHERSQISLIAGDMADDISQDAV